MKLKLLRIKITNEYRALIHDIKTPLIVFIVGVAVISIINLIQLIK